MSAPIPAPAIDPPQPWADAPLAARVLLWSLVAQGIVLVVAGLVGAVALLQQPSTGSGLREAAILVCLGLVPLGLGAAGVALGVRRRRSGAVTIAVLIELPTLLLLPIAVVSLVSSRSAAVLPIIVPLAIGVVAFVCAVRRETRGWVGRD